MQFIVVCLALAAAGCQGASARPIWPGKGGSLLATLSRVEASNVDTNAYTGVSNGGAESVGGDYLDLDTVMQVSSDLTQSISLNIFEGPAHQHVWVPSVGTIALGATSPAVLHYTETYVSDNGAFFRDWLATGGVLEVTALSRTAISLTLTGATMTANSSTATGSFTLDGAGTDLVF